MSTKEQHPILQALQDYLDNTSPEQLEQDWKELEKYNQYGPDMEECLELGRQHCIEMMKEEEPGILIDKLGILTKKFNTYDKLRSELWNLLNKYVKTHNIRPGEEFQDFMLKNDGDVAMFFINEYGEPSLAYHTVKIKDLCDGNDKEY